MPLKMQKSLTIVFLASCLLHLPACSPDMSMLEDDYELSAIEVSSMLAPTAQIQPAPSLYCRIGRGEALFGNAWYDLSDAEFALHQGYYSSITISRRQGMETMNIKALFDSNGQKLVFCPAIGALPGQRIACFSLYAVEDDLRDGIKRTIDVPNAIRGGTITCAYQKDKLRPLVEQTRK